MKPIIKFELWSLYIFLLDNMPRTRNSLESWDQALKKEILYATHPAITTKLPKIIRNEQASNEILIELATVGFDLSQSNEENDTINDSMKPVRGSYSREHSLAFLRSFANNL